MDGAEGEVGQEDDGIAATYTVMAGTVITQPAFWPAPSLFVIMLRVHTGEDMASKVAVHCQVRYVSPSDESEDIGPAPIDS